MTRTRIEQGYLSLSVELNALDYLEKAYGYIHQTESDTMAWKWVVISLHGALYGFAICALQGANPDRVTFKTKKGNEKLINFDEALRRCQDADWMGMYVFSKRLQLTSEQKRSIHVLKNVLRNDFEHFIPKQEGIDLLGMPQITIDVLDILRFLAVETGNCIHLTPTQHRRIKSLVFQSKRLLKESKLYKMEQSMEGAEKK